jgi:GTP-binding protein LepA
MKQKRIRNFCIISHIDHGKTTLTDRFLEKTGSVEKGERILDSHPIAQERGVTIKLAPVRMDYEVSPVVEEVFGFKKAILNLIDTPGHVDFSYEVSRSLAACEGAILLVDATQGIQAQTMATARAAKKHQLFLVPVINKIDSPKARIEQTAAEMEETFGFKREEIIRVSAKTGEGVEKLLDELVIRVPEPQGEKGPFRSLVFSSAYSLHKGVMAYVRVIDGEVKQGEKIKFSASEAERELVDLGYFKPKPVAKKKLTAGEVGWIATGLKDVSLCRVGDTIIKPGEAAEALPGYQEPKPMVFIDFYPTQDEKYERLLKAVKKLKLNDAALYFKPIHSPLFGQGLQMGFLGVFHSEVVQERLERDFDISVIATTPSVGYRLVLRSGEKKTIYSAQKCPPLFQVDKVKEPYVRLSVFTPLEYMATVLQLCRKKRAKMVTQKVFGEQTELIYKMPLIELVSGFYDQLKSVSSGFASIDWDFIGYKELDAALLEILVNGNKIAPLTFIVPKQKSRHRARRIVEKMKEVVPRQLFEVVIQGAVDGRIVAKERIPPFRKNVTAKLYGGDQTRKDKLLEKQKEGKKRMKAVGNVDIPQEAFKEIFEE